MSKLKQLIEAANRKCEMAWKVYSYNPEKDNELVDTSKAFDCIAAAQAHKREILEKNPNYTVEIIAESSQKNETKTINDIRTADIAKYLKDNKKTDLKALKLKSKAFAKDLQNYFKLTSEPSVFDIDKVLDALPYFMQEAANIDVKNPGVLEVPDGKKVDELPQSHFEKLIDKKGYAEVIRALTNLEVWNKDKNKSLSSWASNMADELKKKFRPESAQKNEATFKPGDKVSVKSYYKDGNQFITLRNATIIKEITEKEAGQLDPAYNWKEPTGMKYYLVKLNTGSKKAVLASDLTLESAQMNESRNYVIIAKVSVPDNMNNRDVEDKVEELFDRAGLTVIDVEATRK